MLLYTGFEVTHATYYPMYPTTISVSTLMPPRFNWAASWPHNSGPLLSVLLLGHPRKLSDDPLPWAPPGIKPLPGPVPSPSCPSPPACLGAQPPIGSRLGRAGGPGWRGSVAVHSFCSTGIALLDLILVFLILPFCEGCWLFLLEFAAELPPLSSSLFSLSFPDLPGPAPYASSAPPSLADGKLLNQCPDYLPCSSFLPSSIFQQAAGLPRSFILCPGLSCLLP